MKENTGSTTQKHVQARPEGGERILADGVSVSNDTWKTGRNNNDLIIGPTGAGKTRGYVIPNILHAQESMLITDTKGNLRKKYGSYLKARGYQVFDIDLTDMANSSCGYDPLDYVSLDERTGRFSEQEVLTVAAALCPAERGDWDPYWYQAAQMSAAALVALVLTRFKAEDRNMHTVSRLATLSGGKELAALYKELADYDPDCFAVREYGLVHINDEADRMVASVRGILVNALHPLSTDAAGHLFASTDRIDFRKAGHERTAIFLTVSDTDRSMDRLANLFYTQAIHELVAEADSCEGNRLPIPVRLILDDFATNTVIPGFDKVVTTIRSRGIAVSLIVQDLSQLRSLYRDSQATTIANNCDTWLYLGGFDEATAGCVARRLDRRVTSVLDMPPEEAILLMRGRKARRARKYDLEKDPAYRSVVGSPRPHGPAPEPPDGSPEEDIPW
ncbi:MAG: type IV secretory system conjugative DNA transfer family protein [Atopobiaceae bacterium]|jgi:type IV secretion system protein VirD4|nr:type IV secretory system conjugative DNA transfer family protein [Atopobiaceae bacterium]